MNSIPKKDNDYPVYVEHKMPRGLAKKIKKDKEAKSHPIKKKDVK